MASAQPAVLKTVIPAKAGMTIEKAVARNAVIPAQTGIDDSDTHFFDFSLTMPSISITAFS